MTEPTPSPDEPVTSANIFKPPYTPGTIGLSVLVRVDVDGLWAEIPGMPGLFATGATPTELGTSLGVAVETYLNDAAASTEETPEAPETT